MFCKVAMQHLNDWKEWESMNSEKILNAIPKLQKLSDDDLDLVMSAINSCLVVQAMQQAHDRPVALERFVSAIRN